MLLKNPWAVVVKKTLLALTQKPQISLTKKP
jgi:hypothetical protein